MRRILAFSRNARLALAACAAALTLGTTAQAAEQPSIGQAEPLVPHLLLVHGGAFLFDDPSFDETTRQAALDAGFVPHYLTYPLGDFEAALRAARTEARRLGALYPGRLYAYGSSAGGTLVSLLAGDGMVRAAVAKAPVSDLVDWRWPLAAYGSDYYEQIGLDLSARYRLSPLRRRARRPLLLVQGRGDRVVPAAMNDFFAAKFHRVHLWTVPGGHWTERLRPQILAQSFSWLARTEAPAGHAHFKEP